MSTYLTEIQQQPDILRGVPDLFGRDEARSLDALREALAKGEYDRIVMTGMGGSLFSAYPAFLTLSRELALPVTLVDCAELVTELQALLRPETLLIVISQSGESTEIKALSRLQNCPKTVIAVSNNPESTLALWADLALFSGAGVETAVSTKSYTGGLAVLHGLAGHLVGCAPSAICAEIRSCADAVAQVLARGMAHFDNALWQVPKQGLAFVGAGPSFASAGIGALVTQEAAKLPAMAFSLGQFRHGPVELIQRGLTATIFSGAPHQTAETTALAEWITENGGRSYLLGNVDETSGVDVVVPLPPVAFGLIPILEALPIQLMQIPLCDQQGIAPGVFDLATKVT